MERRRMVVVKVCPVRAYEIYDQCIPSLRISTQSKNRTTPHFEYSNIIAPDNPVICGCVAMTTRLKKFCNQKHT